MSEGKLPLFRFAPSPNGPLHLGHAYSALCNAKFAKLYDGRFILRIEDIDLSRRSETHIAAIYRDLHWLGLSWPTPVRLQSDHLQSYLPALAHLTDLGLLYPCFATRAEINRAANAATSPATDPDGALLYPSICKAYTDDQVQECKNKGMPFALRLHMDKALAHAATLHKGPITYKTFNEQGPSSEIPIDPARWGDIVIARKDVPTSYHLAVVIDDHHQAITHICRGKDLEAATDIHRLLQIILGLDEPAYHHHDLVLYEGEKLSKSKSHPSLFELREQGITSEDLQKAASISAAALSKYLP